jgi:hypothetical protein
MSENIEGVKSFINDHLVKVLWAISLYFLTQLSSDFKDVKSTLQAILINQATMETRLGALESTTKQNTDDIRSLREYHSGNK